MFEPPAVPLQHKPFALELPAPNLYYAWQFALVQKKKHLMILRVFYWF
jgi:hypothetical protein